MAAVAEGLRAGVSPSDARQRLLEQSGRAGQGADKRALQLAVRLWFLVTLIGQFLFVVHIVSFYGRTAASGNFAAWNKHLTVGYVAGDTVGNSALGAHLMMAAVITLGGLLQLIPQIRRRAPTFHRWVGRIYIPAAFLASASAIYLILVRGGVIGGNAQHWGNVINACVIMLCAAMAWRYALAREFAIHRRWALRLFLAVSGSWFFRMGLFFWLMVNRGPVGFDADRFEGPFLVFLQFAQYLIPLAVLELYLRAQDRAAAADRSGAVDRAGATARYGVAAIVLVLTVVTAMGIVGYTAYMVSAGAAV